MGEALQKWQWLLSNTAESHDGLMLELPRAWEPPVSQNAAQPHAALGSRDDLLVRNKKRRLLE